MEVHQNKALSRIIQCFALFLVVRLVEELFIIPRYINTKGPECFPGTLCHSIFQIHFYLAFSFALLL